MDKVWMKLAEELANEKSKDPKTKVGCFIVDSDNRPVSSGYNGMPPRVKEKHLWVNKKPFVVHAEENAMLWSRRYLGGCQVYVTHAPCLRCMVQLYTLGVRVIFYKHLSTSTPLALSAIDDIRLWFDAAEGMLVKNFATHKTYLEELDELSRQCA